MFNSKKSEVVVKTGKTDTIGTILGQETVLEGLLTTKETVRIDGLLKGEIRSESSVIIGETGRIEGNIHSKNILVAGFVDGNITIDERMEVTSTGMIAGDIVTKILVIEEGGSFKGNCTMETMMTKLRELSEEDEKVTVAEEEGLPARGQRPEGGKGTPAVQEREAATEETKNTTEEKGKKEQNLESAVS